ncbi:MAG TPA: hypothetical protein VNA15_10915 [Candidatus Angelobacter sp.]|nr:hypothetical protein [Candidatus Angelobacter sp.]
MPLASPPPKNCPVCGEGIWARGHTMNIYQARHLYNVHVHTDHPEYERWNKRMKLNNLVTIVVAVFLPSVGFLVSSINVASLFTVLLWGCAFVVGVAIWVTQRTGTRRFRDSWNKSIFLQKALNELRVSY